MTKARTKRTALEVVVDTLLAAREVNDGTVRRMNRADLARNMGVRYSSMWGVLGSQRPGLPSLQRVAAALDISTAKLVDLIETEALK